MPAPANDDRATAEQVTVGPYWGVFAGTTVDATEDAAGPFAGWGVRDVWYTWSSLPAGQVYFRVLPATPAAVYMEAAAFSGAPLDWVNDAQERAGFGYHSYGGAYDQCIFAAAHTGGPFTLCVYGYTGFDELFDFQVGWGHELDATASHWSGAQVEPWDVRVNGQALNGTPSGHYSVQYIQGGLTESGGGRWGTNRAWSKQAGAGVPAGHATCVYDNARSGVVFYPASSTVLGCSDLGTGPGSDVGPGPNFGPDVGQVYATSASNPILPNETTRGDEVTVTQSFFAWRLGDIAMGGPVSEADNLPPTFDEFYVANGRLDQGLVWGYQYVDPAPVWDTRNYHLSTWTIVDQTTTGVNVHDPCTVRWRAVDQSYVWPTLATAEAAPGRLYLPGLQASGPAVGLIGDIERSFFLAEGIGAAFYSLPDGDTNLDFAALADMAPYLRYASGETEVRWLVGVVISDEVVNGTPPTFADPPPAPSEYRAYGGRSLHPRQTGTNTISFESRLPGWRAYLGFPLVPPVLGGWHVGRAAMSTSGPW